MIKDLKVRPGARRMRQFVLQGEHERQDFKYAIGDARKIARSISAFANRQGGRLLIGVKDNGVIAGVRNEEDIYVVENAASRYCRPAVGINFEAYSVDTGINVIVAHVPASEAPVYVDEGGGKMAMYCRIADCNILAPELMGQIRQMQVGKTGMTLPQDAASVISYYRTPRPAHPRSLAIAIHTSEENACACIKVLACAGILRFGWTPSGFTLVAADTACETPRRGVGAADDKTFLPSDADNIKKFGGLEEI